MFKGCDSVKFLICCSDLNSTAQNEAYPKTNFPPLSDGNQEQLDSDISPIASPTLESGLRDSGSSFCVSPIDETAQLPHHKRNSSRISADEPVPEPRVPGAPLSVSSQPAPKAAGFAPNHKQPTRWDAFSGEPSNTGKASEINPKSTAFHKVSGSHATNLLNWGREQLHPKKKLAQARSRISTLSKTDPLAPAETRGRSPSRVFRLGDHSDTESGTQSSTQSQATDANSQLNLLGLVPTTVTTITAGGPLPLVKRPATEHAYTGNRQEQPDTQFDSVTENTMHPEESADRTGTAVASPLDNSNHAPRDSLNCGTKSADDLPSIMSRRRPVPVHMPVSRKPVPNTTSSAGGQQSDPPEGQTDDPPKDAQSRIASLEARRDDLYRRRINLETVIKELNRVIQPTSTAYDLAAKAEVKKSVQSIENEIAEIKREEHELGMKVTRAWRRLDEKENNGDGSNLWVKRVTS